MTNMRERKPKTLDWAMSQDWFIRGYVDKQHNKTFPADYETAETNDQWLYERGRGLAAFLFGTGASFPRLIDAGKVTRAAKEAFRAAGAYLR